MGKTSSWAGRPSGTYGLYPPQVTTLLRSLPNSIYWVYRPGQEGHWAWVGDEAMGGPYGYCTGEHNHISELRMI